MNPEIDKFCLRLNVAWQQVPYLRFGQFMWDVITTCQNEGKDSFYLSNDEFMQMVNKFLRNAKNEP